MTNEKISKEIKDKMDRELRQYWGNQKELQKLKQISTASSRRYLYIEKRLEYIETVVQRLKPFEKTVFYLIFKENRNCDYCEANKNISRSTYYNIYNKAIKLLAEEWGEI